MDEELVVAVHPDHPLTGAAVTLADLKETPLVSLPRGTGVRTALDAACAQAGFAPTIVFEASALPMVVNLAAMGLGAAVVPASTAAMETIRILRITAPAVRSRLELAWNPAPQANPAARVLIDHARRYLSRPTGDRDQPARP